MNEEVEKFSFLFDDIYCVICKEYFLGKYPELGRSIICINCNARGYGTYDTFGYYEIEWYKEEKND